MALGPAPKELLYCYVGGCEFPSIARGLCRRHYLKSWRHDTLPPKPAHVKRVKQYTTINNDADRKLHKLARQTGRRVSDILRDIIEAALATS